MLRQVLAHEHCNDIMLRYVLSVSKIDALVRLEGLQRDLVVSVTVEISTASTSWQRATSPNDFTTLFRSERPKTKS